MRNIRTAKPVASAAGFALQLEITLTVYLKLL